MAEEDLHAYPPERVVCSSFPRLPCNYELTYDLPSQAGGQVARQSRNVVSAHLECRLGVGAEEREDLTEVTDHRLRALLDV